jgi:HD-GYP domain-containing protein (c-di-GMP phosphodiesterase class II)
MREIIKRQMDRGTDAPVGVRIIAAVNAYDEMTEEPANGAVVVAPGDAMKQLRMKSGSEYDQAVIKAMESVLANRLA